MKSSSLNTFIYTALALVAFAANSVICRLALNSEAIDAASFTLVRLFSGALFLILLVGFGAKGQPPKSKGSWLAALMLFIYAITFSYAYISLDTGTGALILFGTVQITMLFSTVVKGHKLKPIEWSGIGIAFLGFVYLVFPTLGTPTILGFLLMTSAGISWGLYSILGAGSNNPLSDTAFNFLRTLPFCIVLTLYVLGESQPTNEGVLLAIASGALASGVGYSIWYLALKTLDQTHAAVVQLTVPVIAAFGGVMLSKEHITLRLVESSILVLGGILVVILGKKYKREKK